MTPPKIIALDLDGTLLSMDGQITPYTREKIRHAANQGIAVVISTGRPYVGLPIAEAKELGIQYAITANGAAIYRIADRACLFEEGLPCRFTADILRQLYTKHLHLDAFIQGDAYTQTSTLDIIHHTCLPESVKSYILTTRQQVDDLASYILEHHLVLQKATINFEMESDGTFTDREVTKTFLMNCPDIHVVSGGYHNLEFTKAGVTKAVGLRFICDYLHLPIESSMVCGDSENDQDILKTAGLSIAMANASDEIKAICDYTTASCNEDGVGRAIEKFAL